jgi:hypothetical protein
VILPISASQVAGITGMNHLAWPQEQTFKPVVLQSNYLAKRIKMKYKFCKIEGKYYHSSQCMLVYSENPRE